MKVCILGMGSGDCLELTEVLNSLLREIGDDTQVVLSDDIDVFLRYGIKKTPALLVNDKLYQNEELQDIDFLRKILLKASGEKDYYH
jgi:hypothetical protein